MNTRRTTGPLLPLGDKKGFDENLEPGASLKSVAESGVLLESLVRSRNKWLYETFPKYASKPGRGTNATRYYMGDPDHPPSFHDRGTCDIDIGPHTFSNTVFFEVYRQGKGPPPGSSSSANVPAQSTKVSGDLTTASPLNIDFSEIPDLSEMEVPSDPHERREYLRRVHNATAYDAKNAAAVHAMVAQQGKTVDDVLAMLRGMMELPLMPFDLAISFEGTPSDRYLIPRDPALFEILPNNDARLTVVLPFDHMIKAPIQPVGPHADDLSPPVKRRAVSFMVRNITPAVADTLNRWIGDEERMTASRAEINALRKNIPLRLYLGPQVKSGAELLAKLKAISEYPMKLLKQGPTVQRPVRAKQSVQNKALPTRSTALEAPTKIVPASPARFCVVPSPGRTPAAAAPHISAPPPAPPSHSAAGSAAPTPSHNPYASVSMSSSTYPSSTYAASARSTYPAYPPFPQPPPPPPPFSPLTTLSYAPIATITPYGSQLHPTQGVPHPTITSPYYTYAHYHPSYAPYPSRPNPAPQAQTPAVPRYKAPVAIEMKCLSCGAKDVPLYYGGRFCRPCQDEGLDLEYETRARSLSNEKDVRPSPYPASRTHSSSGASRPRSRQRHSTHAETPTFSLTPATFDDTADQSK